MISIKRKRRLTFKKSHIQYGKTDTGEVLYTYISDGELITALKDSADAAHVSLIEVIQSEWQENVVIVTVCCKQPAFINFVGEVSKRLGKYIRGVEFRYGL